jgi:hypothetical protein
MKEERDPVAAYKALLRELIDRRPSGTRRKLAVAFGTHPSFISQITNPALRVPLPAQHVPTLFRICHFAPDEQRSFLALYAAAHPSQSAEALATDERDLVRVRLPVFGDPERREEVASLIRDFAERVIALAQRAERSDRESHHEEADQRPG